MDHAQSVGKGGLDFFLLLVDEHSAHLLVDFSVFLQPLDFLQDEVILLLLF